MRCQQETHTNMWIRLQTHTLMCTYGNILQNACAERSRCWKLIQEFELIIREWNQPHYLHKLHSEPHNYAHCSTFPSRPRTCGAFNRLAASHGPNLSLLSWQCAEARTAANELSPRWYGPSKVSIKPWSQYAREAFSHLERWVLME